MKDQPQISVVIPCLNEEGSIEALHDQLDGLFTGLELTYEIIFVDDGSSDTTPQVLKKLTGRNPYAGVVTLTRNFGHQNALLAGLSDARGERILTMDADFQHPPSVIPEMLKRMDDGFEVVAARRIKGHGKGFKAVSSRGFYKMINLVSEVKIPAGVADFRLMSRRVLDAYLKFGERNRFSRGLFTWMGYEQALVDFTAPPRESGETKYSLRRMCTLAVEGITSFSSRPLWIAFSLGLLTAGSGLAYAVYALIRYFSGNTITGWASLMITVLIIGGIQLITLGLIGVYISRIYSETKQRPHYLIKNKLNRP